MSLPVRVFYADWHNMPAHCSHDVQFFWLTMFHIFSWHLGLSAMQALRLQSLITQSILLRVVARNVLRRRHSSGPYL